MDSLSELGKLVISLALALREVHASGQVPLEPTGNRLGLGIDLPDSLPAPSLSEKEQVPTNKDDLSRSITRSRKRTAESFPTTPQKTKNDHHNNGRSSSIELVWTSPEKYPFQITYAESPTQTKTLFDANHSDVLIYEAAQIPTSDPRLDEMTWTWKDLFKTTGKQIFGHGWWKLAVPAIMFTVQSNLQSELMTCDQQLD